MFSALRQGALLYILDKSKEPVIKIGYVDSVTAPRPLYKTYNPSASFGTNIQTLVDIQVKVDDQKILLEGVPSLLSVHSSGDTIISENRESMIQEVDSMLQNSKQILDNIDKHKKIVSSCERILKELNPIYAKETERDEAIESLTDKVNGMQDKFESIEGALLNIQNLLNKRD